MTRLMVGLRLAAAEEGSNAKLRVNPYDDSSMWRFNSGLNFDGKQLTNSSDNDIIKLEDIEIGRSVGAKAKNYDVLDLQTREVFNFSYGTKIQNVEVFAGKGSKNEFRTADKYAQRYGGDAKDWQHVKGIGVLDYYGEDRRAEVHWVQCQGIGKFEFFVKDWLE